MDLWDEVQGMLRWELLREPCDGWECHDYSDGLREYLRAKRDEQEG